MGSLHAGFTGDYVDIMWRMLQRAEPEDYVVGTGISHSVQELVDITFDRVGLDPEDCVQVDERLYRPAEVDPWSLIHATRAPRLTGSQPRASRTSSVRWSMRLFSCCAAALRPAVPELHGGAASAALAEPEQVFRPPLGISISPVIGVVATSTARSIRHDP